MKNRRFAINIILILLVVIIAVVPLIFQNGAEFLGTDDRAKDVISDINTDYKPWFSPIWQPPSGEVATLLFSLQAAIGAGVIGYYFGRKSKKKD